MLKKVSDCPVLYFPPIFLAAMIVPLVASADCNWGGGASTPQDIFNRSCVQQGGVPHGCTCDAPRSAGSSGSSGMSGSDPMMQGAAILGNELGKAMGEWLFGSPKQDAANQAAAQAAEQARQAEEERKAEEARQETARQQRILSSLKGIESGTTGLSLKMGDGDVNSDVELTVTGQTRGALGETVLQTSVIHQPSVEQGLQLKLGDDADAPIKIDSRAVSSGGVGLSSGPADSLPSLNTVANTRVRPPVVFQGLQMKLGDDAPTLPLDKPVALIPRQGDPEHLAIGSPIAAGRPAICDGLSRQLAETYQLARLSLLASDIYERYESKAVPLTAITVFDRISDKINKVEITEMHNLFPGMSSEAVKNLLQPDDADYRAAIYENYVMGSDGIHQYTKKIVLVFRGTSTLGDMKNGNIPQAAGLRSDYYTKAIYLAQKLKVSADANGYQLELVGHSMGGGMADAAGLANKIRTTTFNPSGVNPNTVRGADMSSAQLYLTDYVVDREPLNWHQDHPELTKAELYLGSMAAIGSGMAAPLTSIAGVQTDDARRGAHELGALFSTPLPAAIGRRVALTPDPVDLNSLDPFRLHRMEGVVDAITLHSRELYSKYIFNECGS